MEWLLQNGLWILLAIGLIILMRRGGGVCGLGGHRHGQDMKPDEQAGNPQDPVTGHEVDKDSTLRFAYQGRIYWFESENSRAEFEKNPEQYTRPQHHRHGGCC